MIIEGRIFVPSVKNSKLQFKKNDLSENKVTITLLGEIVVVPSGEKCKALTLITNNNRD